jgi:ABC-type uncharacterized transport system fused permease/ATPase subunit
MKKIWIALVGILFFMVSSSYFYVTELENNQLLSFINDYNKLIKFNEAIGGLLLMLVGIFIYQIYFRKKRSIWFSSY